jgi:hypothetical protein
MRMVVLPVQLETWDKQKWVQPTRSARLPTDAELEDLAPRNLVWEMAEKGNLQEGVGAISP